MHVPIKYLNKTVYNSIYSEVIHHKFTSNIVSRFTTENANSISIIPNTIYARILRDNNKKCVWRVIVIVMV